MILDAAEDRNVGDFTFYFNTPGVRRILDSASPAATDEVICVEDA